MTALPPGDAVGFGDADRIFSEFLDPRTATLQVNVPASMVARVRDALAASSKGRAVPREPIAACARECRHLMETDSLPRFKKWGPYVAFLDDGVALVERRLQVRVLPLEGDDLGLQVADLADERVEPPARRRERARRGRRGALSLIHI